VTQDAIPLPFDHVFLHRRYANDYEKSRACYCSGNVVIHQDGCHASRPKCKWMRRVRAERQVCCCSMYPFPHRRGSGRCTIGIPYGLELECEQDR